VRKHQSIKVVKHADIHRKVCLWHCGYFLTGVCHHEQYSHWWHNGTTTCTPTLIHWLNS